MKLIYRDINAVFDTETTSVNTLVIENRAYYYSVITQLYEQICGCEGKYILSENNTPIAINKNVELLSNFIPFEINQKPLVTKMTAALEKTALDEHYDESFKLIGAIEAFMQKLTFGSRADISFSRLSVGAIIKAASPQFCSDQQTLAEKLLDHMTLVREYEGKKLFVTVNLRSFIEDNEAELFMDSVLKHGHDLIMLENHEYPLCQNERRVIIDHDLCEIT